MYREKEMGQVALLPGFPPYAQPKRGGYLQYATTLPDGSSLLRPADGESLRFLVPHGHYGYCGELSSSL
jgi:hypothetical protein